MDNFSDDVLEAFKYTFSQKGALTPTINYHRNVFNIGERTPGPFKPLEVPTLLLWVRTLQNQLNFTLHLDANQVGHVICDYAKNTKAYYNYKYYDMILIIVFNCWK